MWRIRTGCWPPNGARQGKSASKTVSDSQLPLPTKTLDDRINKLQKAFFSISIYKAGRVST